MSNQHHQKSAGLASASDQAPDFFLYRERAHQERSKAISQAVSALWGRVTGRRSRECRDARFWTA